MNNTSSGREIAFLVFLVSIFISKIVRPEKLAVIGSWIAVAGDVLQAISDTDEYCEDVKKEKIKEIEGINIQMKELQKRLDELKC